MFTPHRRLLTAAPLLAFALIASHLRREEVVALALKKFPTVMEGREPARFLVMVFDSTNRYIWGFPAKGGVTITVGGDTLTRTERSVVQSGGKIGRSSSHRTLHSYPSGIPNRGLPKNTDDGLVPTSPGSDESGIEGVAAHNVRYVDHFAVFPDEKESRNLDILAVHLVGVAADTGRPPRASFPVRPASLYSDAAPGSGKKPALVKTIVILPLPTPAAAKPFLLDACFDIAPSGDAELMSWTKSRDSKYNDKVEKSLRAYRFSPATLDGVAVRDTACFRAQPSSPPGH